MNLDIEIIGGQRLVAHLAEAIKNIDPEMKEALREVARKVVQDAKAICPVDTGSLRRSIRAKEYPPEVEIYRIYVVAGGKIINPKTHGLVDYASKVEYGTSRAPAQPSLRPALEQTDPPRDLDGWFEGVFQRWLKRS